MAWCEDHGISTKIFRRRVLGAKEREGDSNCAADWMELNGCNSKPSLSPVSNVVIEILAGAYTVRVKPGFNREMVLDVCRILGEIC
jgi:hypothetical protein